MSLTMQRRAKRLTPEQMKASLSSLVEIHERYLRAQPERVRNELEDWVTKHLLNTVSPYLLSEGNLVAIHREVFAHANVSDYLLQLSYAFYAINSSQPNWEQLLAANLSDGLSLDGPDTELNMIPEPMVSMMPVHALRHGQWTGRFTRPWWVLWHWVRYGAAPMTLAGLLASNKVLMLLLMLRMVASTAAPKAAVGDLLQPGQLTATS